MNDLWQNSTFLPIRRQMHAIHRNLIALVLLRCFDHFDIKSMQSHCVLITFGFCVVLNVLWQNSTFLPIRHQIDSSHCILIDLVVLRCFDHFDIKSMQSHCVLITFGLCVVLNVLWQNSTFLPIRHQIDSSHCILITFGVLHCFECFVTKLDIYANSTSNRFKSLYFDHFWSFALFWMFCNKTRHFCQFDIKCMQFIVIWSLWYFCVVLIILTSNRCKVIVLWSLLEFCVVLNVLWQNSTFFPIRRQIHAIHRNLID